VLGLQYDWVFFTYQKLVVKIGSWVARVASKTNIPDAPSDFRATSRVAAQRLVALDGYLR